MTFGCTKPHCCGDGILDSAFGECDLGSLTGLALDRNLNPTICPYHLDTPALLKTMLADHRWLAVSV